MTRAAPLILASAVLAQAAVCDPTSTDVSQLDASSARGPHGVVRVLCVDRRTGRRIRSRAFAIDFGGPRAPHDLMLAAGHALPEDIEVMKKRCRILGPGGTLANIAEVWRPDRIDPATGDDWAVLMTDMRLGDEIARLRVTALSSARLERLLDDETPIRLMLGTPSAEQDGCAVHGGRWVLDRDLEQSVFTHSCRTFPGLSGSPIAVHLDGQSLIMGINLGHRMRPFHQDGPLFIGVGRAIDAAVTDAIEQAARRAREPLHAKAPR